MKFKLPRETIDAEMNKVISRELRQQKINLLRLSKNQLKMLAKVCRDIKKHGLPKHLVLKRLPNKLGYGIFLHPMAKPILKGEVIGSYAGEISLMPQHLKDDSVYAFAPLADILLTQKEQEYFDSNRRYYCNRFYWLNIDAQKKGNFTRFVNHSYKPNVTAEIVKIPTNPYGLKPSLIEVVYIAHKKILPGEQLLISYDGDDNSFWGRIKPLPITPKTFLLSSSLKVLIQTKKV